jgi:hypothetical protein
MLKRLLLLLTFAGAISASAQDRGPTILSDSFETSATFAERWMPHDKRITSEDGKIVFPKVGSLTMRGCTPLEFYAEMDITLDVSHEPDKTKWNQSFCGFMIDGFRFMVLPSGNTWMIYKLKGHERAHGKHVKIDGFEQKKPIKLTLIRKIKNETATYMYRVNGKDAGSFVCDAPLAAPTKATESLKPLEIFSYKVNMTLDNFSISAIKHSADDSPNVILNSSFEHEQDGFPLYFGRSGFNHAKSTKIPYEDFLATMTLDTTEKHSGTQSLKILFDDSTQGQTLWAWGAGTVKDLAGVFSVWLKADRENFPVWLYYGKRQEVKVGTTWKRYEITNPTLPGAGVYSPVKLSVNRTHGTLWVDDLQAEILGTLDQTNLELGPPMATPYKPSELDKQKFSKKEELPVRASDITIKKLPYGLVPSSNLDSWKDKAVKLDTFYFKLKEAHNNTEAYLACDNKHLYIGYRCFFEDLSAVNTTLGQHDSFSIFSKDSVEFFLDPIGDGGFYQFAADTGGTRTDMGKGGDVSWNGVWQADVTLNKDANSVDYLITVPFSTLGNAVMTSRWLVNICRNDSSVKEHLALSRTPILGFKQTEYWPYAQLPEDVVSEYKLGATTGAYSDAGNGVVVSLEIGNQTGRDQSVTAELLDVQNNSGTLARKDVVLKRGENTITFQAKTKINKVRLKLTDGEAPLTDQTVLLEKRNPVSMLGRLNYYMSEKEAVFKVTTTLADPGKMTAVLTVVGKTVKAAASSEFTITIPLKDVPNGTNTVALALMRDGKEVVGTSSELVKRPFKDGATQINHFTRSLMHEGKPVFPNAPFFVFVKHRSKEFVLGAVDWADRYGFKYLHILVENRAVDQAVWAIRHAQEKGIKVMLWTKYGELTDEEAKVTRNRLDFSNVISQMVMDEPELSTPSDVARAFLRKMHTLYPYQPVHMNNSVLGIPNRYADLETDILMLDDYLTNAEKRSVASVVHATDIMMEAGKEGSKPCFYFIVSGNFPLHHREPSYAEQIAQTYGNIAAGCTGLSYFYGVPMTPGNWKAYLQLNKEILSLQNILLSEEEIAQGASSADPKTLRHILRQHNGLVYVVSCNIGKQAIDNVTFTLPAELQYAGEADVMFENRKLTISSGRFIDSFAGHARHVYKVKLK